MSYSTTSALSRKFTCAKCRKPKLLAGSRMAYLVGQVAGSKLLAGKKVRVCGECSPAMPLNGERGG